MAEINTQVLNIDEIFGTEKPHSNTVIEDEPIQTPQFDRFIAANLRLPKSILPQIVD